MERIPPVLILGNPENRRVRLFVEALARHGQPRATVVAHAEALRQPTILDGLPSAPRVVRLESVGESPEVERLLLRLGARSAREMGCSYIGQRALEALPHRHGQILCPRQHHLGFLRYLRRLERLFAARPRWQVLQTPASVAELFDKRITSPRLAGLGIPVAPSLQAVDTPDALRAAMAKEGWREAVIKLSCGSSASGLAVLFRFADGTEALMTTVERVADGFFNSLRVRRVQRRVHVDAILAFLLQEGAHVERFLPKARLGKGFFDCRVLVVAGEPAFTVVRQSHHPITNLHLGGWRGDLGALRHRIPQAQWQAAMRSCQRVWAAYDCFHLGIDVLFDPTLRSHRVIEANAFGDLLPNLQRDGLDVYGWQIKALASPVAIPIGA